MVSLTASDDRTNSSGVREIHYSVNSSAEVIVPDSVTNIPIISEGVNTISYWAVDNAGNAESR